MATFVSPYGCRIETDLMGCFASLCFRKVTSHPGAELTQRLGDPCSLVPFFAVNSKAEVRFHLATADWIAEPVRQKMAITVTPGPSLAIIPQSLLNFDSVELWLCLYSLQHKNKINRAGELILTSECSRYQFRNLADCLQKIRDMIAEASQTAKEPSKEDVALKRLRYRKRPRLLHTESCG